jgi:predicted aspartyl protease
VVSRRRVMRKGRTAGTVFAGAGATVLAVLLSVCGAGSASSGVVPVAGAVPTGATGPAETAVPARAAVKIPGRAVSAPAAIAAARGRVWVANSLYPVTGNAGGWVTEVSAATGALVRVISG